MKDGKSLPVKSIDSIEEAVAVFGDPDVEIEVMPQFCLDRFSIPRELNLKRLKKIAEILSVPEN